MIEIVRKLFTFWNDNNIVYCHWKGNSHIEDAMTGKSDFDILIADNSVERGCDLMKEAGLVHFKTQYGSRFPGIQDWIGVDTETGIMIHVHLHTKMIAGHSGVMEYILPWEDLAFSTRVFDSKTGLFILNPSLEIILLYTRLGIEQSSKKIKKSHGGYKLKEKTISEIVYLKAQQDIDKTRLFIDKLFPSCQEEFKHLISRERIGEDDYAELSTLMRKTCSKWLRFNSHILSSLILYRRIETKFRHKWNELTNRGIMKKVPYSSQGLLIAFLGQDGAGKTTVTKHLIKWLGWKMDVRYIYLGSGDNYSSWKKRLAHKLRGNGPMKYLSTFLTLLDFREITKKAYKNIRKAERYAQKGGIVIYDRFPQIEFEGICDGPKIRKRLLSYFGNGILARLLMPLAKSEERYIKKIVKHYPTIVFKLILPPEESIRRKPHENFDAVKQKHEIIKSLNFDHSDVYIIDATMPFDEEMVLIKNIIWQHIQK